MSGFNGSDNDRAVVVGAMECEDLGACCGCGRGAALAALTAERDTALAQCKAWREEAEAWRAWWPLNVKSDTTERRIATEPNEADIIATDAWDVLEAARANTDALAKKQGDTSCLE